MAQETSTVHIRNVFSVTRMHGGLEGISRCEESDTFEPELEFGQGGKKNWLSILPIFCTCSEELYYSHFFTVEHPFKVILRIVCAAVD